MARWASWLSLYPLESSSPRQAGIHSRFPRSLFLCALGLGQYAIGFLLPAEYFFHMFNCVCECTDFKHNFKSEKETKIALGSLAELPRVLSDIRLRIEEVL